jgi:lipopolysaccharide/colanic/teichoic acid biosynthesis glycosyltransferase
MHATYIHPVAAVGKRFIDLIIALTALVILAPLLPIIIIAIKLDSAGPIIYRQTRVGKLKENCMSIFTLYKFRSMRADAETKTGPVIAKRNDPRVTAFGRFLRKTRVDEIPQLWNVIKGDMSIVGPRPERPLISGNLEKDIPFYIERTYEVPPGITGLAQINMGYNETTKHMDVKVALDHAYALSLSHPFKWLFTDFAIMLKTMLIMIKGKGF